jgi:uncharacterized protein
MYNKGDTSYKTQPKFISTEIIDHFLNKMDAYLINYEYPSFNIVFHGGEPLLAKKELYEYFIEKTISSFSKHNIKPFFGIQTNGVLIDAEWVEIFKKYNLHVGISLDSTKESNDINRVFHNGKSSYAEILKGFQFFKNSMGFTPGILSVIDIDQDPKEVYDHYKNIGVEYVNLLFPDEIYEENYIDDLRLGKWLLTMFNLWLNDKTIRVDQFEVLMSIFYGADYVGDEYYGVKLNNTFILETDGEIQANDPLRVCVPNIHKTKLNVSKNNIMDIIENPLAELYYNSKRRLCDKCNNCQLSDICSGGYLVNRYSKKNGFDNPSIFCKSLAYFITNVQNIIADFTNPSLEEHERITNLNLEEVMTYCQNNDYKENYELSKFKN